MDPATPLHHGDALTDLTATVTFLLTDIEGSTRLWEQDPDAMRAALARHDCLLTAGIQQQGGVVVKSRGEGDSLFAVFTRPTDAVAAACALQQALLAEPWPAPSPLRVRMGLHTDVADVRGGDYYGLGVNRCARLRAVAHGGQVLLSQAIRDRVQHELPEGASLRDLGTHRLKDLQQPEHLYQLLHPALPAEFPPLRSLEAFAHNLPVQVTSFIGREEQMAEVKQLLTTTLLLTLTGSGGCGKTRLALQVAADLVEAYVDGVWLVELAALADPTLVPQTVATALGVREEPHRPLTATLTDYLRPRTLLLLLDNCEHLLSTCAHLAGDLLRSCPNLRVLASSREGLGIAGELTYRVPSLSLPDPQCPPPIERLAQYEAVRLFHERARFSQPQFTVTEQNAQAVAQVCHRLDGIPLAIELAAARVKVLSAEQIAQRLDDRFRLLTGGSRTALPRQQTLRAAIDWSYDLLTEEERALLRPLSVFAGGWTLEAAEAIGAGEGIEAEDVLDLLMRLVEKSLVLAEEQAGGEVRYRLLETVRQYSRDRLLEAGEAAAVRGRHRDWFLALAERAEPELRAQDGAAWLERLESEHDNLRAALAWAEEVGETEAGLRLAGALGQFWGVRGHLTEGRARLARLLEQAGTEVRTAEQAKALLAASDLAFYQGDLEQAAVPAEKCLALSRELEDKTGISRSLRALGLVVWNYGDLDRAAALFEESLALAREVGDKTGIAYALLFLGLVAFDQEEEERAAALREESQALFRELGDQRGLSLSLWALGTMLIHQGQYEQAAPIFEEVLALSRERGNKRGIAESFLNLGVVAVSQGEYERAELLFEQSLAVVRELGIKPLIAHLLHHLGRVAWYRGDREQAARQYEQSLVLSRALEDEGDTGVKRGIATCLRHLGEVAQSRGYHDQAIALHRESLALSRELSHQMDVQARLGIPECLEGIARVATAQGRPERAAQLLGAAEALREAIRAPRPPVERAIYERDVAAARAGLGEEAFAAAWAAGRAMSIEQAIACGLEVGVDA